MHTQSERERVSKNAFKGANEKKYRMVYFYLCYFLLKFLQQYIHLRHIFREQRTLKANTQKDQIATE